MELCQWVKQYKEEQQRSYEEQSVLALEDRKSALLRAMNSSHTGESINLTTDHLMQISGLDLQPESWFWFWSPQVQMLDLIPQTRPCRAAWRP